MPNLLGYPMVRIQQSIIEWLNTYFKKLKVAKVDIDIKPEGLAIFITKVLPSANTPVTLYCSRRRKYPYKEDGFLFQSFDFYQDFKT